ncbi:MAG: type I DNA topoisomerase [Clostridiales bacterium]|jgi:DNA topoisomerase-1|nr:type I DNA topoisomerase [Clostridiales bacterium]
MKKLVIVESPSKAKTIEKYLGGDYIVEASGGHIRDLPEKALGIDIEHNFKPQYEVYDKKKDTVKKLKSLIKKSDTVFLATDPDREGEAISWHLKDILEIEGNNNRIVFNEISKKAVNAAIQNPRDIDMHLVDAQQARRVLDRLIGYKISPILSRKIRSNLSAGRVQSATLKMIVDREREIRAFVPEEYWNLFAFLLKLDDVNAKPFRTVFEDISKKKYTIPNKEALDKILADIKDQKFHVDSVKKGVSKNRPSPPFTTSTMQQDASKKLSMSSPMSMQIAQQLYEGVEIEGEGQTALVTYIRTDSVRVSSDMQAETKNYIVANYGDDYAPKSFNVYLSKKGAQDAHEAIRPISLERTPQSLYNKINRNQYRLYKLIYERYLASQMTEAVYNTLNVRIAVPSKSQPDTTYGFRIKGRSIVFKGFTAVYGDSIIETQNENPDENNEESGVLPNFTEGEELLLKELKHEQKFTKPPSRYTDATLVKAMEENGIGRPSTYATVINVLNKREYSVKEEKFIVPTTLGETVCDYLVKYFSEFTDIEFTAKMEEDLDKIEDGGKEWQEIIAKFYPQFADKVQYAAKSGESVKLQPEVTEIICEKCGAHMVVRDGKYGKFLACPSYPNCKNIKPYEKPVSTCPKCGKDIYKRKSKTGRFFYGCSGYPTCDFISWDVPAPYPCPTCGNYMRVYNGKDNKKYICTNNQCKYQEIILPEIPEGELPAEEGMSDN